MVLGIMPALLSGTKGREKDPVTSDKPFPTTVQNNIKTHPNYTVMKAQPKTCILSSLFGSKKSPTQTCEPLSEPTIMF